MNKIVNGVANDYEFPNLYDPNISYSKAYTEQLLAEKDKEIERLTAESTEWESKCYKYQDIIDELEKEINNQLTMTRRLDKYNEGYFDATLNYYNKLKELKEGK